MNANYKNSSVCFEYLSTKISLLFKGRAADLSYVESVARMIADTAESSKIVVEKSTVPVKAAESVITILRTNHKKGVRYQVNIIINDKSSDKLFVYHIYLHFAYMFYCAI